MVVLCPHTGRVKYKSHKVHYIFPGMLALVIRSHEYVSDNVDNALVGNNPIFIEYQGCSILKVTYLYTIWINLCSTGQRCHGARRAYQKMNKYAVRSPRLFGGTSLALLFHMCCVSTAYQRHMSISCAGVAINQVWAACIRVWAAIIRIRAAYTPRMLGAVGVCNAFLLCTYCVMYARWSHSNCFSMIKVWWCTCPTHTSATPRPTFGKPTA